MKPQTKIEKLVKCPECNGGGLHTSGEGKCYYCSGTIMLPEEGYLYKEKARRRAKKLVRLAFEADEKYNKKECLKMNYEELMEFYCMGAELPMKSKVKYAVEIAIYKKDGETCVGAGIFKGDKMIYHIRKRWKIILFVKIIEFLGTKGWHPLEFSGIEGHYLMGGTKNPNFEKIRNYESTN